MKTQVTASAEIDAPAQRVYSILADYREGQPRILPKEYFPFLQVEQGGIGAGTRLHFQMRVLGTTRTFRATVTEPEPGHVLVETNQPEEADPTSASVTTFTVTPVAESQRTQVTIATELAVSNWLESLVVPRLLRHIYTQELRLVSDAAKRQSPAASTNAI